MSDHIRTSAGTGFMHRLGLVEYMPDGDDGGDGGDGGAGSGGGEKTFTQADVDRIVQDRVARVKNTPPEDYEELKAAKQRLTEIEEANATELEKAQKRAEEAERNAQAAAERLKETTLRSAIVAEAAKKKIVDPDAAVALLDRSKLELDADGTPTNIADAMDALLEAKPYLLAASQGGTRGNADQGAREGGNGAVEQLTSTEGMTAEQIAKAVSEGRLNDYLSTSSN